MIGRSTIVTISGIIKQRKCRTAYSDSGTDRAPYLASVSVMAMMLLLTSSAIAQSPVDQLPTLSRAAQTSPAQQQVAAKASRETTGQPHTLNLVRAYERMLLNDPQYLSALAARDVGRDSGNLGRAALLPQVSINYLRNRTNKTEYYDTRAGRQSVNDGFYGSRAGVTIEQTLFDYSAISTYRMGMTQTEFAEVQFRLQFQQEAVVLIDAYLNAILARDSLALARNQLRIYQDMLRDNERRMALGESTRIDILETRTQMGTTEVELVSYENALADRLQELSALLGDAVYADELMAIDLKSFLPPLSNGDLNTLLNDAREQNPEVQTARLAVRYNDLTIEREKGQFMPRISLFASHERVMSDSINNKGRDYRSNTVGVQVSVPLFNGGSSYYATRQAVNRREQARYDLDRANATTATMVEKYYRVFATSVDRVRMLHQNVIDSAALVEAMRKSVAGGERTNTDALQAERRSYQARQELLHAYVAWFQAYAKLQFYAGRFSEDDVLILNRQLVIPSR